MSTNGRRGPRVRLVCAVAAAIAAVAAPGAAAAPLDPDYGPQVDADGPLTKLRWDWDAVEAARYADVAFPTIAVVDSGISPSHLEFADEGTIDPASVDCSRGRAVAASAGYANIADGVGHGTIVAGLAAAPANGYGIVGASPFSSIAVVRVRPDLGGLACGLAHLAKQLESGALGLLVVNLSLTDPNASPPAVRRALERLVRQGALVVGATGNRGVHGTRLGFPARLPHVLAIGDAERRALLPGPQLDLLAPGGNLVAPLRTGGWGSPGGSSTTSWATALASGAAAAVWGAHPSGSEMTAQQVAYVLRRTARNRGAWRPGHGFGLIDVRRALAFNANALPRDDESEPNDDATDATQATRIGFQPRLACAAACTVGGILGSTDDPEDWWQVAVPAGRRACASITKGAGVRARIVPGGRAGVAFARVTTTKRLAAYTLRVRLASRC